MRRLAVRTGMLDHPTERNLHAAAMIALERSPAAGRAAA